MSPKCLKKGAAYIPMANDIKELFLNEHNKRRSLVAQGKLGGVFSKKTAARMATLVSECRLFKRATMFKDFLISYFIFWNDSFEILFCSGVG